MSPEEGPYWNRIAEVYGDIVRIRDLAIANVLGITCGISSYVLSRDLITLLRWASPEKIKGYALFFGILGCLLSGLLTARWFKAKREVAAGTTICFHDALSQMGVTPEEEISLIRQSPLENQRELYDLGIIHELYKG
jgi:hypothetical protein